MSKQDMRFVLLAGFGLIFAFPPFRFGWIAFVALLPLFYLIENKSFKLSFRNGYLVGVLWITGTLYWIGWATITGLIGAMVYLPLYTALFCGLQSRINRKWGRKGLFLAPLLWAAMEVLMTLGPLGFSWNLLSTSLTYHPVFLQSLPLSGAYVASLWIILINVVIYMILTYRTQKAFTVGISGLILLLFIPLMYGQRSMKTSMDDKENIKVALIQGNIDPYKKWTPSFADSNFTVYSELTDRVKEQRPDLIVWPETATPCYLRYRFQYLQIVKTLADSMNASILTGSPDYEWGDDGKAASYNSALLIQPKSKIIQRYHKNHLVPFSERVPLVDKIPAFYEFLQKINLDVGNYHAGDTTFVYSMYSGGFNVPVQFSTAICFDSVFPDHIREYFKKGARFLVIITNDGWFGNTSGPRQHERIAVLRALENRTWVARCANTGISCFIDPYGRMHEESGLYKEDILIRTIQLSAKRTIYNRFGHWIDMSLVVAAAFFIALSLLRKNH